MTMDITNRKVEIKNEAILPKNEDQTELPATKSIKRSFDVAFLMLPDEKLKQKQAKTKYELEINREASSLYNNNDKSDSDEDIEVGTNSNSPKHDFHQKAKYFLTQKQQIFDDPNLTKSGKISDEEIQSFRTKIPLNISSSEQKSAFTKVNLTKEARLSPNLSMSPDLNYQNSLSPSPPINRNYQNFPANILTPNQIFKTQTIPAYQNTFMQENLQNFSAQAPAGIDSSFLVKTNHNAEILQPNLSKIRPMLAQYRPDLASYNYPQFQTQEMLKMAQPDLKFAPDIRNPAAAILSSLLPPSLAALSLPAQNVCAKCNITFRMTSDLVYHMRSHHKNDSADYARKRREDKLKCPVCAESFRERHHLTRHMTAHQDKDNDEVDPDMKKKNFVNYK